MDHNQRFNTSQIHSASVKAVPRLARLLTKALALPPLSARMWEILKRVAAW
jgi:hypothetical protein